MPHKITNGRESAGDQNPVDAADKKTKLQALREAIGAIPAFRTPRGSMTPKRRRDVLASTEGLCAGCETSLAGVKWIADHRLPLELGGADALSNLQPLCPDCNREKTHDDAKRIAKMRRQSKMDEPAQPSRIRSAKSIPSRPMQSGQAQWGKRIDHPDLTRLAPKRARQTQHFDGKE